MKIEFTPGMSESCVLSRLRSFMEAHNLSSQHGFGLADDDNFLEKAAADSTYLAQMISFIEEEFGVYVSSYEISEDNLGSLRAVARFVASKQPFAVG